MARATLPVYVTGVFVAAVLHESTVRHRSTRQRPSGGGTTGSASEVGADTPLSRSNRRSSAQSAELAPEGQQLDVLGQLRERSVPVVSRFSGKAENPFTEYIFLDLIGSAVDRRRLGV